MIGLKISSNFSTKTFNFFIESVVELILVINIKTARAIIEIVMFQKVFLKWLKIPGFLFVYDQTENNKAFIFFKLLKK